MSDFNFAKKKFEIYKLHRACQSSYADIGLVKLKKILIFIKIQHNFVYLIKDP